MNFSENFSFTREQFSTLLPYHLSIDPDGAITSCGAGIAEACGDCSGGSLFDLFSCKIANTSEIVLNFNPSIIGCQVILCAKKNPFLYFIGKFNLLSDAQTYLLVCEAHSFNSEQMPIYSPSQLQATFLLFIKEVFSKQNADLDWQMFSEQFLESKYLTVNNSVNEEYGITVSTADGSVIWCNNTFEKLTERRLDEIAGKRPRDSIYGEHSVYIDNNYVDSNIKTGQPFYFENIGTSKTGREFWFGVTVQPVFDKNRNVIGRVHYIKDIDTRKVKELELEENENLLMLAVEAAKAGLWAYDMVTGDFKVSKEYKKIQGYDIQENLTFEMVMEKLYPDDALQLRNDILPYLNIDNPSFVFEHRLMVAGTYRYFSAKANSIKFTSDGTPTKIVGTLRDITNEREQLLELERQKQFYHDILDNIPADIALISLDHKYLYVNKTAVKDDEFRKWIIGKDDFEYCEYRGLDKALAAGRQTKRKQAVDQKKTSLFVETKRNKNGEQHIKRMFYPKLNNNDEVDVIIGYAMDVTEQIQNEQYAQLQERRMKTILDMSSDGIFRSDADGTVIMCNDSFRKLLNTKEGEPLNIFSVICDDDRAKFIQQTQCAIETGEKQTGMFILRKRINSEQRHFEYYLTKTVITNGNAFSGRISDVTEIVMKEQNMQKAIDDEIQLNKYKTQFIHISSHELRTPLTIIQSNTELLQLCLGNPALRKKKDPDIMIGRIIKEVEVMTEILNKLMLVSKIENGEIEIERSPVNMRQFINSEVISIFNPYSDGRRVQLNMPDDVFFWDIDGKILRHALINLLSNAFKYSYGKSAPTLTISKSGDQITFYVEDKGIGIPEDDQKKLFQSFYRASNVGVVSGTGIGLKVVEYAVKKHNGTISIKSEAGKGSTFIVTIPK